MVTVRDVNNLKLDGMELIAGESGLNRIVSWTAAMPLYQILEHEPGR